MRPFRKCSIHESKLKGMFKEDSLASKWLWLIRSKAFEKSKKTALLEGYCPFVAVSRG